MNDPILPPPILGILPGGGTAKLVLQVVLAFVAAALMIGAVWYVFVHPHQASQAAAQARTDANGAQAQADAATGSIVILRDHQTATDRITKQTEDNSHEIHNAPGAGDQVDPGLDLAGRRALCLHDGRANDPQCTQLLHPHS